MARFYLSVIKVRRQNGATIMFEYSILHESCLCEDATHIAASERISLRSAWCMTWRNHMRNIRQSMKRVSRIGDVDAAAKDTDLHFCIIAFKKALQEMLQERNAVKKTCA